MPAQVGWDRLVFSRLPTCSWPTMAPTEEALTLSFTAFSDSSPDGSGNGFLGVACPGLPFLEALSEEGGLSGSMDSEDSKLKRSSLESDRSSERSDSSGFFSVLDFRSLGRLLLVGRRSLSLCLGALIAAGLRAMSGSIPGSPVAVALLFAAKE